MVPFPDSCMQADVARAAAPATIASRMLDASAGLELAPDLRRATLTRRFPRAISVQTTNDGGKECLRCELLAIDGKKIIRMIDQRPGCRSRTGIEKSEDWNVFGIYPSDSRGKVGRLLYTDARTHCCRRKHTNLPALYAPQPFFQTVRTRQRSDQAAHPSADQHPPTGGTARSNAVHLLAHCAHQGWKPGGNAADQDP